MTNDELLNIGRTIEIDDKVEWLVQDRIVLVCRPSPDDEYYPYKYALLYDNNVRVGIVFFMGSWDIHWLIFPEHRGKGYMSHFVRSGTIRNVEPELKATMIDPYRCDNAKASTHLAKLAGLKVLRNDGDREKFQRQLYKDEQERINAPCPCGSGKKYKNCCRNRDEWEKDNEMHPCWDCDAYRSHTTATRCWKCGEEYDI
jgi:hypothetical protein